MRQISLVCSLETVYNGSRFANFCLWKKQKQRVLVIATALLLFTYDLRDENNRKHMYD